MSKGAKMKEMSLKDLQKFSLRILKDVHSFCKQNNIKYSLGYGTLIGAIRHKGFIPWDDDIDIIMPRDDFERFCRIYSSKSFHLISPQNKECWIGFARVCDLNETYADCICEWTSYKTGVWIDIFPIDGASDNYNEFKNSVAQARKLWVKQQYCRYAKHTFTFKLSFIYNLKLLAVKIITLNGIWLHKHNTRLSVNAQQFKLGETKHWSQLVCIDDGEKNYQDINDFKEVVELPFEDGLFYVLSGYDRFLRNIFGDYMKLPPIESQKPKQHDVTFYWKTSK